MHLSQFLPRGSRRPQPFLLRLQSFNTTRLLPFYKTARRFYSDVPAFATAFRAKNIYVDCFPCTLHHYSSGGPRLSLYDGKKYTHDDDPDRIQGDRVEVGDDGFVDPALTSWWNGVSMFPNTLLRQQIWANWGEWAEECREQGWEVAEPWIFTLPRGTPLSPHLFLVHEKLEKYHLLPRVAKTLPALEEELDDYFRSYGSQMPQDEWGSTHFLEGYHIHEESQWMCK